jgi:hypothetical protein
MIAIADFGLHSVHIFWSCYLRIQIKAVAAHNVRGMKNDELRHQDIDFLQLLHSNLTISKILQVWSTYIQARWILCASVTCQLRILWIADKQLDTYATSFPSVSFQKRNELAIIVDIGHHKSTKKRLPF